MIAPMLLVLAQLTSLTNNVEAQQVVFSPALRFDSLNRLRSLREESGATRWVARDISERTQVETALNGLDSVQAVRIHYNDGYRRIATDQTSGPKRFLYGRGFDELIFLEKGGTQRSPVVSQLGSTMKLFDASGSVADQFRYDAFGTPLAGNSAAFPHLFAGAIYDQESRLYDLRHRHYDPATGRFLSRDPLGAHADPFNAGNAYAYVGNNPLTRRDPLGLATEEGFFEWLDRKTWEVVQGVGKGGEMFLNGVLEGLQETQRMFDDAMCFGLNIPAQSQIGKKIESHEKQGASLPEALGGAAMGTVVETGRDLKAAATILCDAIGAGDTRTAAAILTGVGLGIVTPGPDEFLTIKALEAVGDARTLARTGIGPGLWKWECREISGFVDVPTIAAHRVEGTSRWIRNREGRPLMLGGTSNRAYVLSSVSRWNWKGNPVLCFNLAFTAGSPVSPQEMAKAAQAIWQSEFASSTPKPRLLSISVWNCSNLGSPSAAEAMVDYIAGLNEALSKGLGIRVKLHELLPGKSDGTAQVLASLHYPK